jgi:hypothetical protein
MGLSSTTWDSDGREWASTTPRGPAGSLVGGVSTAGFEPPSASAADGADHQVVRSGTLEIIGDPLQAAEQLRNLATQLSGFVVTSKVSGSDGRMQSAQITVRIPAENLDEARAQVRAMAASVEQDTVEARDVTREYVDQEAALRNTCKNHCDCLHEHL